MDVKEPGAAPAGPNEAEIAAWNGDMGARWVDLQQRIDALFAPLTEVALGVAAPRAGERVLDIGCGCGATVLELAGRIGQQGSVLGVDVSQGMLDVARRRVSAAGLAQATLLLADASRHDFAPAAFDLVFSRFGVMFFDDPVAAFAHIRGSLAPDGRLVFAAWRPMSENPWFLLPWLAAKPHLPPQPKPDPHAPGPFAFADPERVKGILETAGFANVAYSARDTQMRLADPGRAADAADFAMRLGPVSRALNEAEPEVRARARAAILAELAGRDGPDGVVLGGAIWLVRAQV